MFSVCIVVDHAMDMIVEVQHAEEGKNIALDYLCVASLFLHMQKYTHVLHDLALVLIVLITCVVCTYRNASRRAPSTARIGYFITHSTPRI